MGGLRRRVAVLVLVALAISASAAKAEPPAGTLAMTLAGPVVVSVGTVHSYSGQLTLAGAGLPQQAVGVRVNGVLQAQATTTLSGFYSASLSFPAPGAYSVQAVAYSGTPLETKSPSLTVQTTYRLSVARVGTGSGTVSSNPTGISCGSDCDEMFNPGTAVTLSRSATAGSVFAGWGGACSGTGSCVVTMDGPLAVTATFNDVTPPNVPSFTGTIPASPANHNSPRLVGLAETASTVRIYTNDLCAGSPLASGSSVSGAFSITVGVADNTTTSFYATATDAAGNASSCSEPRSCVEDSVAPAVPEWTASAPSSPANHNMPALMGTAEADSVVTVFANAACSGSSVASGPASTGAFSIAVSVADDSTTTFAMKATDPAGNPSACSAPLVYVEDSAAPATPVLTSTTPMSPADDNGPSVNGSAESGSTVRLYANASCSNPFAGTGTAADGTFSIGVNVTDNSITTFYGQATDAAGNVSACSAGITYVEDSVIPAPASFTTTTPASPANNNAPLVNGTAEEGSTVRLYTNASCSSAVAGSGTATGGTFSISVTVADNSTTTFYAKAIDAAANASACSSSSISYVEDSLAPPLVVFTGTTPASPASSNSPTVSGTAESGSTVRLYTNADCSSAVAATGTATGGAFSLAVTVADDTTTTFYATSRDAAGNTSACSSSSITYVEDSTAPVAPTVTGSTPASPANNNTPTITGAAETGATVRLYTNASCSSAVAGTGMAAGGAYSITATVADNTTTTFYVKATDAAGNASGCSASSVTYVEDSIAPGAPTFTGTTPFSPANNNNPSINGTAESGSTVRLYTNSSCSSAVAGTGIATAGSFSITVTVADNSTTVFYAKATDPAANASACSTQMSYVEDSIAPPAPTVTGSTPASPANNNNPTINGTADAGSTVTAYTNASCSSAVGGMGTATGGSFSVFVAVADNTTTTFYARASDTAGNASPCSASFVTYVEDSIAPSAPAVTGVTPASPANNNSPTITGTAEASSTVRLYTNASCSSAVAGTGTATGGAFSIAAGVADDSTTTFYAKAADGAGNASPCSASSATYVEDSTMPAAPAVTGATPASPANNNNPAINGTAESASTVRIYTDAACSSAVAGTGTAAGGAFSIGVSVADNTTTTFYARATDPAANVSPCSASSVAYVEDSTAPTAPAVTGVTPASPANNNAPAISGTAESGSTVRLYTNASCSSAVAGTGTATGGAFSVTATVTDNTTTTLYAKATDAAANPSPCSASSVTYVEDSAAPTFVGLASATVLTQDTIRLSWAASPASDGVTPAGSIVYDICRSTTPGSCAASFVVLQATSPGATTIDIGSLTESTRYFFVVRARDQAGNRDANTIERAGKTLGARVTLALAAGGDHTCASLSDGSARCWGHNLYGQLGNGTTNDSSLPVTVSGLNGAVALAAGYSHSCALLADGTARCWGDNSSGQLGNGTTDDSSLPVTVSGLSGAVAITAGLRHTCALLADGTGRCWGGNGYGELGNGTTTSSSTPVVVSGLSGAVAITAGPFHTCAVLADGTGRCWGDNNEGQLGNGTTTASTLPVTVSGLSGAVTITAAGEHSCATLADGSARCWGSNHVGELGNGTTTPSSTPVVVSGLSGAVAITAGNLHSCALLADGTARCWGTYLGGYLETPKLLPVTISGLSGAVAITAGARHTCAVRSDGTGRCWGESLFGKLGGPGNGTTPVTVLGLLGTVGGSTIATGSNHTCSLLSDGTGRCWGRNTEGQLGNGTTISSSNPVAVSGLSDAVSITNGRFHTCALISDGTARCWGANEDGQLGTGTWTSSSTPVVVAGLSGAVAVTAGDYHTCALLSDGTGRCWGSGFYGQLGNGSGDPSYVPVTVSGLSDAIAMAAGGRHTCALLSNGSARCWGYNFYGQLGNAGTTNSSTPVSVAGLGGAVALTGGLHHTCALLADGTGRCWGANSDGQLGNGTQASSSTPVTVSGLSGAVAIIGGLYHTCAIRSDGTARCWGRNLEGQLGDGTTTPRLTPVIVSVLAGSVAIAAGGYHTCAVRSDGTGRCWGYNASGQLGTGTTTATSTPVPVYAFP